MTWANKYWDAIDQLYWDPSLLGLASIPKGDWRKNEETITIPRERVRKDGSIYTRKGTAAENAERMRRLEEPLNHIFDITFGIAPDSAIEKLFLEPLGFRDGGPFLRLGREIVDRYRGFEEGNTTQQDGFYVGPHSLVGIELKIGSKTWPGQALKYVALMVAEEKLTGRRDQLGLLYITPGATADATFAQLNADANGRLAEDFVSDVPSRQINPALARMIEEDREHFDDAVARLRLAHQSWNSVASASRALAEEQDASSPAGQAYQNLMTGFADAIVGQNGCC